MPILGKALVKYFNRFIEYLAGAFKEDKGLSRSIVEHHGRSNNKKKTARSVKSQ